jgi:hypothetical protein
MARSFNGTSDIIKITHSAGVNPTGNFTISFWFNPTVVGAAGTRVILDQVNAGADNCGVLFQTGASNLSYFFAADGFVVNPGSATLVAGTWYNVITTWVSGASALLSTFINGVSDGTHGPGGATITWGTDVTSLGGLSISGTDSDFTNCLMADWAIWSTVLSAGDIAALAAGRRAGTRNPGALGAWLPLSGTQSPEPDLSGNGNVGVLTGTSFAPDPPQLDPLGVTPILMPQPIL